MIKHVALFFAVTVSLCFFGTISYGAEPKQAQCDIGNYALQQLVSGVPISDTLRQAEIIAVKVDGEKARGWIGTENTVRVAYSFDLVDAQKNLNQAAAMECQKFVTADLMKK